MHQILRKQHLIGWNCSSALNIFSLDFLITKVMDDKNIWKQ